MLPCVCILFSACRQRGELPKYLGREQAATYLDRATHIAHVDLEQQAPAKVNFAVEPRRIRNRKKDELWDLTLAEAVQTSLANSVVIRDSAQFLNPGNPLFSNPEFVNSVYDIALQESGVLFGQRGVEAALSDFDAQFTTQLSTAWNQSIQNNLVSNGLPAGSELSETTDQFSMSLQKRLATGGQVSLSHNWTHSGNNVTSGPGATQLFTNVYEGAAQLQFRQPLLAGGGVEYTRIAGPISANIQGVTGVQQGVIISRIENDQELAEFETAVHQMIHDVEQLYWQLHFAYHAFDISTRFRNEARTTWELIDSQRQAGTGVGAAREAEIHQVYLDWKGRSEQAHDQLYSLEAQLRRLLGLPVNDGRIIRPVDSPMTVEFFPDWQQSLTNALVKRPEVRKQKWSIQSLELQLTAAENLLLPRLDFVSSYRLNGFGDELFGQRSDSNPLIPSRIDNGYESLLGGDQAGVSVGLEFSIPIGRRFAKSQVRSLELQLAKARAVLSEQEAELSHEVAAAFREVDRTYVSMENTYNIQVVADRHSEIAQAQYRTDPQTYSIESVLRSQEQVAQQEIALASAIIDYNLALTKLSYRTGKTLNENNITLLEGRWEKAAYLDAREKYEARKFAKPARRLQTQPQITPYYGEYE